MDKHLLIKSIISNLQAITFENKDITLKQLASAIDLLDAIAIDMYGGETKEAKCHHPKDKRKNMNAMGMAEGKERFQCLECYEIIEQDKEEG